MQLVDFQTNCARTSVRNYSYMCFSIHSLVYRLFILWHKNHQQCCISIKWKSQFCLGIPSISKSSRIHIKTLKIATVCYCFSLMLLFLFIFLLYIFAQLFYLISFNSRLFIIVSIICIQGKIMWTTIWHHTYNSIKFHFHAKEFTNKWCNAWWESGYSDSYTRVK